MKSPTNRPPAGGGKRRVRCWLLAVLAVLGTGHSIKNSSVNYYGFIQVRTYDQCHVAARHAYAYQHTH